MRRLLAVAALLAVPAAHAADPPKPAVTLQALPLGRLLEEVKAAVRAAGGDKAVDEFDKGLQSKLGDAGFTGLDMTRPPVGYLVLDAADPDDARGVVMFPVTSEKDFVALLGRLKVPLTADKDNPGAYTLPAPSDVKNFPDRLRFAHGHAVFGFKMPAAALAADKVVPPAALADPAEPAAFLYTVHFDRVPATARKVLADGVANMTGLAEGVTPGAADAAGEMAKLFRRYADLLGDGGKTAKLRVRFDPAAGEVKFEAAVAAKPGSKLAAAVAAYPPTTNKFARVVNPGTAVGFRTRLPLFAPEIRSGVDKLIADGEAELKKRPADEHTPSLAELLAGLKRTVATGQFDLAGSLSGPTAGGRYHLVLAVAFEDPSKLAAELRKLHAAQPDEIKAKVTWDVAKQGDVAIHEIDGRDLAGASPLTLVFGDRPTAAVAFAPKGIYVVFGPQAVAAMKDTLTVAAQFPAPAPAAVLDVGVNADRLAKLEVLGDAERAAVIKAFGAADELRSLVRLEVAGGAELRVGLAVSLRGVGGSLLGLGVVR